METRLALEWEIWAIAQLAAGATIDEVAAALGEHGLAAADARAKLAELVAASSFAGLRARIARGAMAEQLLRAATELAPVDRLDRVATIGEHEFHERYWTRGRPLLLTDAIEMRARGWSIASLAERFGSVEVAINTRRGEASRRSDTEAHARTEPLGRFLAGLSSRAGNDDYIVSKNGLLARPELGALWDDLAPLPAMLVRPTPPRGASLWIGPAGTITPPHFDPHAVLLVQLEGRKRVRLAAPANLVLFEQLDGYFATRFADVPHLECVLEPGHALFIPVAWFHEVTALDPSMTLSLLCFRWANDFHWLQPG